MGSAGRHRLPCFCTTGASSLTRLGSPSLNAKSWNALNARGLNFRAATKQQQISLLGWLREWQNGGRTTLRMGADTEEIDPGVVEGTTLRIVKYPHPALRAENKRVDEFDPTVAKLAKEMLKVMYASKGVGLAAPQVGQNVRLMVFNPEGDSKAWVHESILVNPEIVGSGGGSDVEPEGCLSFPGMQGDVERSKWVKVAAQRPTGKKFTVKYTGWKARIFQHEYDHLDGVVYIDRLKPDEKARVAPVLETLVKQHPEDAGPPAL